MGLHGKGVEQLRVEGDSDRGATLPGRSQEPVVPSASLAQAITDPGEPDTGNDHHIRPRGVGLVLGNPDELPVFDASSGECGHLGLAGNRREYQHPMSIADDRQGVQGRHDPP